MSIYEWLVKSKSIGQYFLRCGLFSLYMIIIICATIVINKMILSSNENYILISMSKFDSIIIIGLMIFIILAFYGYISNLKYTKEFKFGKGAENFSTLVFVIGLIIIVSSLVYFFNNYYVFYNNKIEKHSILGKTTYNYEDIDSTNTGYESIKNGRYLYYDVNFKNGKSIDIANGLVLEDNGNDLILKIDKIINKNK